jgi:hypothetical protein
LTIVSEHNESGKESLHYVVEVVIRRHAINRV